MTEDDKKLRENLEEASSTEDDDGCVPIYGGPIEIPSAEGAIQLLSDSTVDFETQVERDVAMDLPCRYCEGFPESIQSDGKVESGCCTDCPHEGAELTPGQWIEQNRKDK